MIPVKICGITNLNDALTAIQYGVTALGFVFAPSKRQVTVTKVFEISRQLPPFVSKVGVFVDEDPLVIREILKDCQLDLAQLHGKESVACAEILPGRIIKAFKAGLEPPDPVWRELPLRAILIDAYSANSAGGTGQTFDWSLFDQYRVLGFPMILAGGLNPDNILEAIEATQPNAVDLSSGVEQGPGLKNPVKIRTLMQKIGSLN